DEGVVERATAHVRKRSHFNYLALNQFRHSLEAKHFIEGVVEWTKIRVDLLREVTRQETQLLTSFHCRTYQQNAADALADECFNSTSHSEVGLAGTGGTNTEVDVVLENGLHVVVL